MFELKTTYFVNEYNNKSNFKFKNIYLMNRNL